MNICLIRCPSPFLIDDRVFPPLGLMAVGTKFKQDGHDVLIWDEEGFPAGYDAYGFGPTTPEYSYALKIKDRIKVRRERTKVILGGPHANNTCWSDGWDNVFIGNFVDENLIIDRSLVDIKSYKYFINDRLATTLVTAVGCPYNCAFCSKTNTGVKFKSAENVIEEIEMLNADFGYDALMFFDDTFILNYARVKKICASLKERGIIWRCFVRADLVIKHGEKLLKLMKDSGCVEVGMGIESGSDAILKTINKGESVADIKAAVKVIKSSGIRIKGFLIVGLPGESYDTLDDTQAFLSTADLDDVDFTIYRPYPGSPIWNHKEKYDIDWSDTDYYKMFYKGKPGEYHSMVSTSILSSDNIVQARDDMESMYKCPN